MARSTSDSQKRACGAFASGDRLLQRALESSLEDQSNHMDNDVRYRALVEIDAKRDNTLRSILSEALVLSRDLTGYERKRAGRIVKWVKEIIFEDARNDSVMHAWGLENGRGIPRHRTVNTVLDAKLKEAR